jgi:hypothetical protein
VAMSAVWWLMPASASGVVSSSGMQVPLDRHRARLRVVGGERPPDLIVL